jgi:hypothetical protein
MEKKSDSKQSPVVELRKQPGVDTAALISRLDFGADGSRVGLLVQLKERVEEAKADFLVIVGGLVSERGVRKAAKLKRRDQVKVFSKAKNEVLAIQKQLVEAKAALRRDSKNEELKRKVSELMSLLETKAEEFDALKPKSIQDLVNQQIETLAQEINEAFPKLYRSDGSRMKTYVVTSAAYDGEVGCSVVKRLLELRKNENDIRYLNSIHPEDTTFRISLQKSGKTFAVVVPNKAVWHSKYYSAAPDRFLDDERKRTTQKLCDVYAFGCGASSLNRPDGEIPFQRITVPALCKLDDVRTSENMIGIRIVRFVPNERANPVTTISLKDLVSNERQFVTPPANCTRHQVSIIEWIKKKGNSSVGLLEDNLGIPRASIERALEDLVQRKQAKAGLCYDEESQRYDFCPAWFKRVIRYIWPKDNWQKDVLAGFGCLHGGSVHTAYKYVVKELPSQLVKEEASYLLGVGDLVEGLKHNLAIRGEVFGGLNNTAQEKVTAYMVAEVILEVLNQRLDKELKEKDPKKLSLQDAEALLMEHMLTFLYWIGNHDAWAEDLGYDPLDTFESTLREQLSNGLEKMLAAKGLPLISLKSLIGKKVVKMETGKPYTLPSGLKVDGSHYFAGRTQTSSTWLQRALAQLKKAQLVWVANFHVAEIVEEWSAEHGLRVAMQLPTLKSKSAFEQTKGKMTDFGVGLVKAWSCKGRIMVSETSFLGTNPNESLDRHIIVKSLLEHAGVGKWVDLSKIR